MECIDNRSSSADAERDFEIVALTIEQEANIAFEHKHEGSV